MLWPWLTLICLAVAALMIVIANRKEVVLPGGRRVTRTAEPAKFWAMTLCVTAFMCLILSSTAFSIAGTERQQAAGYVILQLWLLAFFTAWLIYLFRRGRIGRARRDAHPVDFWGRWGALAVFVFLYAAQFAYLAVHKFSHLA